MLLNSLSAQEIWTQLALFIKNLNYFAKLVALFDSYNTLSYNRGDWIARFAIEQDLFLPWLIALGHVTQ